MFGVFFPYIIMMICACISSFELKIISDKEPIVYKTSSIDLNILEINPMFNFTINKDNSDCSLNQIFYESAITNDLTRFRFSKEESDNFTIIGLYVSNNYTNSFYGINNINDTTGIIEIYHQCIFDTDNKVNNTLLLKKPNATNIGLYTKNENENKNWCLLNFVFQFNQKKYNFEFVKICNEESRFFTFIRGFSIFIIAIFCTFLATYTDIKLELIRDIREQNEIKWWHGLAFILVASIFLILIFYFSKYLNLFYSVLVTLQCLSSCYITISFFLKKLKWEILKKELFQKEYLKIFKIISALGTICIVFLWFISRHWILNNILAFCLVYIILSMMLIKNFKVCCVILLCVFIYDIFWVFFSSKIFDKNVMVVAATSMNLPIKIEMPILFSNSPIKNCILLGLGDIAIPGMVIKFLKRFDDLKNNKNNYYFKLGMILYIISLILAFLSVFIFAHPQPVLFYICPIFIWSLVIVACAKNDWYDFWRGKNLTGTQQMVEEIMNGEFVRLDNIDTQQNVQQNNTQL